jgi:hypothetical protein
MTPNSADLYDGSQKRLMYTSNFDWREEPHRFSAYSLSLLLVFIGAVGLIVYVAAVLQPWGGDSDGTPLDARTYADRGLTPLPVEQVTQPQ